MNARVLTIGLELIDDPSWMGGTLYLRNLAVSLARLPSAEQPRVRLIGPAAAVQPLLAQYGHLPAFAGPRPPSLLRRAMNRLGATQPARDGVDVVYPGFGSPVPGAVTMRWVPDFQHRHLPQFFSAQECEARDRGIGEIADRLGVVVFSSEVAAGDFARFFPGHRATARVWRFCSLLDTSRPPDGGVPARYGLPDKYLYLPNQFWAHKNHITVFRALARLRAGGLSVPLVCTGAQSDRRNEGHFASLQGFLRDNGLESQVSFLGLIDRGDQVEVLRRAAAVVQPSLFEGWSTVVEDVRAAGRPVFLSDLPVHREQDPPRCTFFGPQDDEALAQALSEGWNRLSAGPDASSEASARRAMDQRILDAGRAFCDIARTAWSLRAAERT